MADSPEFERFTDLYQLTERMIDDADKHVLAEVARILALNVAHYRGKYGELPLNETLALLGTRSVNDEQAKMLADGMEELVAILSLVSGAVAGGDPPVH